MKFLKFHELGCRNRCEFGVTDGVYRAEAESVCALPTVYFVTILCRRFYSYYYLFLSADVLSNMSGKYAGVGFYFTHINYISL